MNNQPDQSGQSDRSSKLLLVRANRVLLAAIFAALALGIAMIGSLVLTDQNNSGAFNLGVLLLGVSIPVFWVSLALNRAPTEYFAPVMLPEPRLTRWHRLAIIGGVLALGLLEEINANILGLRERMPAFALSAHLQFLLLVGGALLLAWGFSGGWRLSLNGRLLRSFHDLKHEQRLEIIGMLLLFTLALMLRGVNLERTIPGIVDEVSFTTIYMFFRRSVDIRLLEPLNTVAAFPRLYVYLQWSAGQIFGHDLNSLRLISAVFGSLTVPALYWLGKHLFDRRVGAAAALLLAAFPVHIQLSRIGLNNVADPLFGVLTFALLMRGMRYGGRANFAFAGITLGMTQYFHEAGRLTFPVITLVWMSWILIRTRNRTLLRRFLITVFSAVVLALPVYLMLIVVKIPFTARIADVGLRSDYWQSLTGIGQLLGNINNRAWNALALLIYHPERILYYAGSTPYILYYVLPFVTIGLAYALWRWSRPAALLILLWLAIPLAGIIVLLAEIMSARTTVFLPTIALAAAVGVVYGLRAILDTRPRLLRNLTVLVVVGLYLSQTVYYFGLHLPIFIHEMYTLQPWQQMVFETRDFPPGTQINVFMNRPPDQNYLLRAIQFIAGDSYTVTARSYDVLTADALRELPHNIPQAVLLFEPDDNAKALVQFTFNNAIGPTLISHAPYVDTTFVLYLIPAYN